MGWAKLRLSKKASVRKSLACGLALGVSLLAGCAVLVPSAPPSVYDLALSSDVTATSGSTRSQILITEPKVLTSLDNDRIVIKPSPAQIAFFGDVRWSDRLPRLVQLYLSRAFSETNGARAVGLPGDGLIIDHQLLFDLRSFQIEPSGNSFKATVEIAVRILNDKNGRVIASKTFAASQPSADDAVKAVTALNGALDDVAGELIAWVYGKI